MRHLAQWLAASLVGSLLSIAVATLGLVQVPEDYFVRDHHDPAPHWLMRNAGGWLLIIAGVLMSLPGVPGQGLLTVLSGLILIDFPRKRSLELALMRRPQVRNVANAIR